MSSKILSSKKIKEIKENINKLPLEEKIDILKRLEDELFALRFKALLEEIRTTSGSFPLTLEEIAQEVEVVRKKRYEGGN